MEPIILQEYTVYDHLIEMDVQTGRWADANSSETNFRQVVGRFSEDGGQICAFYRLGTRLFLKADKLTIDVTADVEAHFEDTDAAHRLVLRKGIWQVEITESAGREKPTIFECDPTPFVSDDDFDFLLFISKTLSDAGRRQRVFRAGLFH